MVSPKEIEISNEVDFYVNANFIKENQKIQSDEWIKNNIRNTKKRTNERR